MHISINKLDYGLFKKTISHELMHVYRNYCLMKHGVDFLKKDKERHEHLAKVNSLTSDQIGAYGQQIQRCYYCSDKEEINSMSSELYYLILDNKNINRNIFY